MATVTQPAYAARHFFTHISLLCEVDRESECTYSGNLIKRNYSTHTQRYVFKRSKVFCNTLYCTAIIKLNFSNLLRSHVWKCES
jgi:hypothetical protein